MCLKDDVFGGRDPSREQLAKERALKVKQLITEAEGRKHEMCYISDAAVELLKQEQYDLARQL